MRMGLSRRIVTILAFITLGSLSLAKSSSANCLVYSEEDSGGSDTLRYILNNSINTDNGSSLCEIRDDYADDLAGFQNGVYFATTYVYGDPEADDAVDTITLNSASLQISPKYDVKIGNSTWAMVNDPLGTFPDTSITDSVYVNQYETYLPGIPLAENDRVIIHGRDANLKCASDAKAYVYLSDVIVEAAADGERMNSGCWRNAGAGYLCDGTIKEGQDPANFSDPDGADYTKWCESATVIPDDDGSHEFHPQDLPWQCVERAQRWQDQDGDGYGNSDQMHSVCGLWKNTNTGATWSEFADFTIADGHFVRLADNAGDCDDANSEIHPGQDEICDGVDNNCSDSIDESFEDLGEDCSTGTGACESSGTKVCTEDGSTTECNATAGTPTTETCNTLDDDCDGSSDEEGICTPATETLCDDFNADGSEVDNDLDGVANCEDSDCENDDACTSSPDECSYDSNGTPDCYDENCFANTECASVVDADQDGDTVTIRDGDCNDDPEDSNAKTIYPEAKELCADQMDNNCDGAIDDTATCVNPNENDPEGESSGGCSCNLNAKPPTRGQAGFNAIVLGSLASLILIMRRHSRRASKNLT